MIEAIQTTVVCQDLGDGSGDVLKALNIGLGDSLGLSWPMDRWS
jgi:hypothetical protein